jgi:drug/metabolite transporter (DMT)-like permease
LSASESSHRDLFSVVFITDIAESDFLLHTGVSAMSWAGFAYLTLAGSVTAYTAYTAYVWLLDRVPGSLVTTYTFITPIIALLLGWTFLGERLSAQMLLGTILIIASVILVWRLEIESGGHKDVPDMSSRSVRPSGVLSRG